MALRKPPKEHRQLLVILKFANNLDYFIAFCLVLVAIATQKWLLVLVALLSLAMAYFNIPRKVYNRLMGIGREVPEEPKSTLDEEQQIQSRNISWNHYPAISMAVIQTPYNLYRDKQWARNTGEPLKSSGQLF